MIQLQKMITLIGILSIIFFTPICSQAQVLEGNFEFEGLDRHYYVFLPQDYQPNMPVVFNLHGYTYDAWMQMNYSKMNEVADTSGFIVVYPDAIEPGFNGGVWIPGPQPIDTTINDIGFISALIDTIDVHYDIDTNRVYCCGLSNGGQMTYRLTCQLGHRFAAVASVSGCVSDVSTAGCLSYPPMPTLHIHGTADNIVPYIGTVNQWGVEATMDFWIEKNGCSLPADTVFLPDIDTTDGCTVQKISYTNCENYCSLILYKVIGGGHSWPGADTSYSWSGSTNKDIHASVEIWNFFKDFPNTHCLPEGIIFTTQEEIDNFQSNHPVCTEVEGDVTINGDDINDLSSLENISAIGGDLTITGNDILETLTGLEGLKTIDGKLEIIANPMLTNIHALDSIEAGSITDLNIYYNFLLSACDAFCICNYLIDPIGDIDIHNNAPGCNSQEEVELACFTSVEEKNNGHKFIISPNPCSGAADIKISNIQHSISNIQVYTIEGMKIKEFQIENNASGTVEMEIDLSDLPAGLYYCVLRSNNQVQTTKLIKL